MPKRTASLLLPILLVLVAFCPARADKDDIDNNADLQDTPEEIARAAVLKRWPDATDIDVLDLTDDDMDDEDANRPADAAREDPIDMLRDKLADLGDKPAGNKDDDEDGDDPEADFTLSVTFQLKGLECEALINDKGVIRYVYEEVPVEDAPVNVMKAAREAVKDGEFLYVDKVRNETKDVPTISFVVGVGEKDVFVDSNGKVLKVEDAPAEEGLPGDIPKADDDKPVGADGML